MWCKKGFGFVYHTENVEDVEKCWLGNIPKGYSDDIQEAHLFR